MAYDGMYGDLSTRGTTNEILTEVKEIQAQVVISADQASTSAAQAVSSAALAQGASDSAAINAGIAANSASAAATAKDEALLARDAAIQAAEDAVTNSEAALIVAESAQEDATEALNTANGIAGTANTALTNANAAVVTANAAAADASTALATANSIAGTANTALANSNAAVSTANAASATATAAQTTANNALPKAGGVMTGAIDLAAAVTVASAATTNIGAANSNTVFVSGTTTITSLGTAPAGVVRYVRFTGTPLLTHNATSLILPGAANIQTAVRDTAEFYSLGSGNWACLDYQRDSGQALVDPRQVGLNYIEGLQMVFVGRRALTVNPGAAFVPALGRVIELTSPIALTGLSLLANGANHVYLYLNAGVPAVEVVNTLPVKDPSGAWLKSTDPNRRYIGSVSSNGSNDMWKFNHLHRENRIQYIEATPLVAPFTLISGFSGTFTPIATYVLPVPTTTEALVTASVANGTAYFTVAEQQTAETGNNWLQALGAPVGTTVLSNMSLTLSRGSGTESQFRVAVSTAGTTLVTLWLTGYKYER